MRSLALMLLLVLLTPLLSACTRTAWPEIDENGNWYISGKDTGIPADENEPEEPDFRPVLRFAVASDVYFTMTPDYRDERLRLMYEQAYAFAADTAVATFWQPRDIRPQICM